MNAGRLDQQVAIERLTIERDGFGGVTETWAPVATVWAAVEPLNGREYFAAAQTLAEVTTRIRLRYRPGLSVVDRIRHGDVLHDIMATINVRSRNRELTLMCKARPGAE